MSVFSTRAANGEKPKAKRMLTLRSLKTSTMALILVTDDKVEAGRHERIRGRGGEIVASDTGKKALHTPGRKRDETWRIHGLRKMKRLERFGLIRNRVIKRSKSSGIGSDRDNPFLRATSRLIGIEGFYGQTLSW